MNNENLVSRHYGVFFSCKNENEIRKSSVNGWNENRSGGVRKSRFRKTNAICYLFLRFSDAKSSDAEYIPERLQKTKEKVAIAREGTIRVPVIEQGTQRLFTSQKSWRMVEIVFSKTHRDTFPLNRSYSSCFTQL